MDSKRALNCLGRYELGNNCNFSRIGEKMR